MYLIKIHCVHEQPEEVWLQRRCVFTLPAKNPDADQTSAAADRATTCEHFGDLKSFSGVKRKRKSHASSVAKFEV